TSNPSATRIRLRASSGGNPWPNALADSQTIASVIRIGSFKFSEGIIGTAQIEASMHYYHVQTAACKELRSWSILRASASLISSKETIFGFNRALDRDGCRRFGRW